MGFQGNQSRPIGPIMLVILVALAGLVSGVFVRDHIALAGANTKPPITTHHVTATATTVPGVTPTATSTPVAPALAHFSVKLTISPKSGPVGTPITITATATQNAYGNPPMPGLTCYLRAPTDGSNGLLTNWPTQTATNTMGQAQWTTTVPSSLAPGNYEVEVYAKTPSWGYTGQASFIVTAS